MNKEIAETESRLKRKLGNKNLERKLRILRQQANNVDNQEIVWNLKKLKQKYFEGSNKPGKLLANLLNKKKEKDE